MSIKVPNLFKQFNCIILYIAVKKDAARNNSRVNLFDKRNLNIRFILA